MPHPDQPHGSETNLPTPEEMQRKLGEFLKSSFGDKVAFSTFTHPDPADSGTPEPPAAQEPAPDIFHFHYQPRDIKAHLDRFVIRQDEAKKVLSIAVCDHYNHVNHIRQLASDDERAAADVEYAKGNVILLGPTGVGKTYLVKHVAELIGVPFVKADATKFSETGYVGGDVEDLVRDLIAKANGDIQLAQYGIIYIDEIDKIAAASNVAGGRDVSGRGVQTTLLKLMEETEVSVRNPMDIQAQLQGAFEFQRRGNGKARKDTINTRHILFIVSGAFQRLRDQIVRRLRQSQIGFAQDGRASLDDTAAILREAETRRLHRLRFRAGIHRPPARARGVRGTDQRGPARNPPEKRGQHHPAVRARLPGLWDRGKFHRRRVACAGRARRAGENRLRAAW